MTPLLAIILCVCCDGDFKVTRPVCWQELTKPPQIWAKATSIVGAGAESKPHAIQVPINMNGTSVDPGDVVFSDVKNGVVIIPRAQLSEVISLLPRLVEADDRVKEDVSRGISVQEAFKTHRGS